PVFNDVAIGMGSDASRDRVLIANLATRGSLSVDTGAGDDFVILSGSTIGDGFGFDQFVVNTGAGSDGGKMSLGAQVNGWADIRTYGSLSENDSDVVEFETEVYVLRDAAVRTGGGADLVLVNKESALGLVFGGLKTGGSLTIDTGAGDDTADLQGV